MPFKHSLLFVFLLGLPLACSGPAESTDPPPVSVAPAPDADFWNNASIYFLLTDRFRNGDTTNDQHFGRRQDGGVLRSFLGGDFRGVTEKIREGYFNELGVTAIWMNPFFEQIHGSVDEGTGNSYGFHGYWARDWTAIDPNFGTQEELAELVRVAHENGIRIIMDVVINHTGPVTPQDPQWPDEWVITDPRCRYEDYASTVHCTLVDNLPDVRTGRDEPVALPAFLREKWEAEGRLEEELAELDAFFARTGYPRAPRYYIIKWLADWVRELGIDGYRVDTAKHFEEDISEEILREARVAFADWKARHPERELPDLDFFMMGEVYGYGLNGGRFYDFGDKKVDYFRHGYHSLINFSFIGDARLSYEDHFRKYADSLGAGGPLAGLGLVNYLSSHDDANPFDPQRAQPLETANRLLLSPGAAQIYYGDETARPLRVEGAVGDANLRSRMNWDALRASAEGADDPVSRILQHWQKLGRFRQRHLAIGAGTHQMLQAEPYYFARRYENGPVMDRVIVGLDLPEGAKAVPAGAIFDEGVAVRDAYSGQETTVEDGMAVIESPHSLVLLERADLP